MASASASAPTNLQTSLDFLTSLRAGCLASLRVRSDKCVELLTSVGSGPKPSESCASFDRDSESLRTRQASLFSKEGEPGTELCQDWSRSGMIAGGMYFPLPRLVQGISASGSSSSLPTPRASEVQSRTTVEPSCGVTRGGASLLPAVIAKLLPTPTARDYKDTPGMARTATDGRERDDQLPRRIYGELIPTPKANQNQACKMSTKVESAGTSFDFASLHTKVRKTFEDVSPVPIGGMRLTPEFLCWLMGYPPDWLKPLRDALETPSARKS